MTTRMQRLREFRAHHLVQARALTDDNRAHLMAEYASHLLCGPLALSLDVNEAKLRESCQACADAAALRVARSA